MGWTILKNKVLAIFNQKDSTISALDWNIWIFQEKTFSFALPSLWAQYLNDHWKVDNQSFSCILNSRKKKKKKKSLERSPNIRAKITLEIKKWQKIWWRDEWEGRLALVYQDTPMLVASLKGWLALVYLDTLMLAPYSSYSPINTPPPPLLENSCRNFCRKSCKNCEKKKCEENRKKIKEREREREREREEKFFK